jgi:hypothetical protein
MHPRRLGFLAVILGVSIVGLAEPMVGQEIDEAARRAQLLTPLLDNDTFAVIRVDVEKIDIPSAYALAEQVPDLLTVNSYFPPKVEAAAGMAKAFRAAGGKDFYVLLGIHDFNEFFPSAIVPLAPGADPDALAKVARSQATERLGEVLFSGSHKTLARLQALKPSPRPGFERALAAVADSAVQLVVIPTEDSRAALEQFILPHILGDAHARPLIREALWIAAGFSFAPRASLKLAIGAPDARTAERIKSALGSFLASQGEREIVRLFWPRFDEISKFFDWKHQADHSLSVSWDEGQGQLSEFAQIAVVPPLTVAASVKARDMTFEQLKTLEIGLLNHHDDMKAFPPPAILSKDGKPLLSWRVKILPYIDENQMYRDFHLDEPWDSPHNKQFIVRMPAVYRCVKSKVADSGRTVYQVPRGPSTVFSGPEGIAIRKIIDGTSRTISIVEVDDERAVPWTKPDDWTFDPENPTAGLGGHYFGVFLAGWADGHASAIPTTVDKDLLRAAFTRDGREPLKLPRE